VSFVDPHSRQSTAFTGPRTKIEFFEEEEEVCERVIGVGFADAMLMA